MHPTEGQLDSALCKKAWKRKLQINKHLRAVECLLIRKKLLFPNVKNACNTKNKISDWVRTCLQAFNLILHGSFLPFFKTKYQILQWGRIFPENRDRSWFTFYYRCQLSREGPPFNLKCSCFNLALAEYKPRTSSPFFPLPMQAWTWISILATDFPLASASHTYSAAAKQKLCLSHPL